MLVRSIAAATLAFLVAACVQRDYLVAGPSGADRPASETRYTANTSYVTSVEVIPLRIDPAFAGDERQEILRAAAEWNYALNGYVRFDPTIIVFRPGDDVVSPRLDAPPPRSNAWSIFPSRGANPIGRRVLLPMALTQPAPHGGGVVMIYRDQADTSAIAAATRHELGHVLGLLHIAESRLMSPVHDPAGQICIDKAAVAAVAELRFLPLTELNWCEELPPPG